MEGRGQAQLRCNTVRVAHALALLLFTNSIAMAADCGDDVHGQRIACACGDTVVSDTRLRPSDPVVHGRCPRGGLSIRADTYAETLTLDLAGLSIVGSGVGDGIATIAGGSDGAVVTGGSGSHRGEIVGFGIGVNVRVATSVRRIESLEIKGQRHEGLLLRSAGTLVRGVHASRNGGDGIRVTGQGGRLVEVESSANVGAGVRMLSRYTACEARAEKNRTHGIVVRGSMGDLTGSIASNNEGYGVVVGGYGNRTTGVVTEGNGVGTIAVTDRRERP